MAQARLQITKAGSSGILVIGVGRDHNWHLESSLPWLDGMSGTWVRRRNATKFRQFTFLELLNTAGDSIARMQDFPYRVQDRFQGHVIAHVWIFETEGDPFDVLVQMAPPQTKRFQISESWSGSLSYVIAQTEVCGFEIVDADTGQRASYVYRGVGLSLGPPIKRLPNALPGLTTAGPPNDFTAPGWMSVRDFEGDATLQTFYNVGMGTSISRNKLEFAGGVDNAVGFLAQVDDLQTGHTISLPSTGFSSGSMSLADRPAAAPRAPMRPR